MIILYVLPHMRAAGQNSRFEKRRKKNVQLGVPKATSEIGTQTARTAGYATVDQLRKELRKRGLKMTGNKIELIERLSEVNLLAKQACTPRATEGCGCEQPLCVI